MPHLVQEAGPVDLGVLQVHGQEAPLLVVVVFWSLRLMAWTRASQPLLVPKPELRWAEVSCHVLGNDGSRAFAVR